MVARSTTSCSSAPTVAGMMPKAAMLMSPTLTMMPSQMLCRAIRTVSRPISTALAVREMSSTSITASADSLAAVAPFAPIAMPTSAAASTGASFTPSPTMITGRSATAATSCTLSAGRHSARTLVMPISAAM